MINKIGQIWYNFAILPKMKNNYFNVGGVFITSYENIFHSNSIMNFKNISPPWIQGILYIKIKNVAKNVKTENKYFAINYSLYHFYNYYLARFLSVFCVASALGVA